VQPVVLLFNFLSCAAAAADAGDFIGSASEYNSSPVDNFDVPGE